MRRPAIDEHRLLPTIAAVAVVSGTLIVQLR